MWLALLRSLLKSDTSPDGTDNFMKNTLQRKILRGTLFALGVFSILMNLAACDSAGTQSAETSAGYVLSEEPSVPENAVEYLGKYYLPSDDLQTILIMGLDKNEEERPESSIAYTNKMQSDFLLLLVIDEEAKVCEALHLNRDTMTEIQRLGIGGSETGIFVGQLALAHTYGSGGSDSCINAKKAVSGLLGGVAIDHYMTLTMDAVAILNDLVGGVTLTLMEDFTEFDPAMKKGETLTLKGNQALTYVRFRMTIGDGLNESRMRRQEQYLSGFYTSLLDRIRENEDFLKTALMEVNDSFTSDLTVSQLDVFGETLAKCTVMPFRGLKGRSVRGEDYYEYYVDEDSLQETVMELFYREVKNG